MFTRCHSAFLCENRDWGVYVCSLVVCAGTAFDVKVLVYTKGCVRGHIGDRITDDYVSKRETQYTIGEG